MEFIIYRTSCGAPLWYNEDEERTDKPCKNAYPEVIKDENNYYIYLWKIKIDNLDDLVKLNQEVGALILRKYSIEIYDQYRE